MLVLNHQKKTFGSSASMI